MRDAYLIAVASVALVVQVFRTWIAWAERRDRRGFPRGGAEGVPDD